MEINMKRDTGLWQFVGFAAVSLLGTLLHFLYELTGSTFAALFSAVNESTWEHMKLIFFPMLLFALIESRYVGKEYENYWCIKLKGTLIGLIMIPALFYTLRGAFGETPDYINISIFFVSAAIAFFCESKEFKKGSAACTFEKTAPLIFILIAGMFWIFTFIPPEIPLFRDPVSGDYGLM